MEYREHGLNPETNELIPRGYYCMHCGYKELDSDLTEELLESQFARTIKE